MNVYREHQHENTVVYAWKDEDFEFPAHWHTQVEIVAVKLNLYDYMCRGLDYINKHYCDESICLQEIAKNIGISPCYFSRCFKMYSGYQLAEYINRKRVKKADKMLKETDKKITDISMECGYGSLRNFNRVYKEITGNTPQQMREKHLVNKR